MGKVFIKTSLKSSEEDLNLKIEGIKTKNKIIYKDNNVKVVIEIKEDEILMNRSCNEYNINFIFKKDTETNSIYELFGAPKKFLLSTKTTNLLITNNKIIINYELEGNKFLYNLEVEDL